MDIPDPPGMPADERMTPAEFRVAREWLGLTGDWLAAHLQVNPRTVRAWGQGKYPIPDGVREQIKALEHHTGEVVSEAITTLNDMADPAVVTYRSDAEYHAAQPGIPFPASWHRAAVARVAQEVPGLVIVYPGQEQP